MQGTLKYFLLLPLIIGAAYLGYYYGVDQSASILQKSDALDADSTGKEGSLEKIDLPIISHDLKVDQIASKLNDLNVFRKDMRLRHSEIQEQIESIQSNTIIVPDAELLSTEMLSELPSSEELLSSGIDIQTSVTNSYSGESSNLKLSPPVDHEIKLDLQINTGISPNDIDSAFNLENTE